jgi:hypothetical protein
MAPHQSSGCSCSCTDPVHPCNCGVQSIDSTITFVNRVDHFLARWGVNRMGHKVLPGLYQIGTPTADSPVFASANYTLSFDALRSALAEFDAYILVLDTKGINVWCAAGKGTFGTGELVHRIETTGLSSIVNHRKIVVPQLGAPGISAHEVHQLSGFRVAYGPVRARDLPEYIRTGKATPEMRRVQFSMYDRLILMPIELVHIALPAIIITAILWFLAGMVAALAAIITVLAGTVLFPVFLPFITTRDFSTKGLLLGILVAIPFSIIFASASDLPGWAVIAEAAVPLLIIPAVTAYLSLNFTGSTTFTSRTGVKKEIFRYIPVMAVMVVLGVILWIVLGLCRFLGMI